MEIEEADYEPEPTLEETLLYKKFRDGLAKLIPPVTVKELKESYDYCGGLCICDICTEMGDDICGNSRHTRAWRLARPGEPRPDFWRKCVCGATLSVLNCYLTNGKRLLTVGSCCVKRFCEGKLRRHCPVCGDEHKRRKTMLCFTCEERSIICGVSGCGNRTLTSLCKVHVDYAKCPRHHKYFDAVSGATCSGCVCKLCPAATQGEAELCAAHGHYVRCDNHGTYVDETAGQVCDKCVCFRCGKHSKSDICSAATCRDFHRCSQCRTACCSVKYARCYKCNEAARAAAKEKYNKQCANYGTCRGMCEIKYETCYRCSEAAMKRKRGEF